MLPRLRVHERQHRRIEAQQGDGAWQTVAAESNNYLRLVRVPLNVEATAVRLVPEATWGAETCRVFAFDVR